MKNLLQIVLSLAVLTACVACLGAAEVQYSGRCDLILDGDSTLDHFTGNATNVLVKAFCATNEAGKVVVNAQFEISPYQLSTNNKKRDANMYKMFGADRFTNIVVVLTNAALDVARTAGSKREMVTLRITMHGVTREARAILLHTELGEDSFDAELELSVSLKDFELKPPKALLGTIVVHDTVKLKARARLRKEPP